jgi:probable AcnD-accessory protein PrpF
MPQIKISASYMRGGTSKGVFFALDDLPQAAQVPGSIRDKLLLRVIGSPDPYSKHTDGMGGATSSTSKVVIVSKSEQTDHDIDYLFGQVAIDKAFVDWSGNCGNLSAAVGPFAIAKNLIESSRIPDNGIATVRIWQVNIQKTIIAHIPVVNGEVQELGDFELDGVTFPAAEIPLEFLTPADSSASIFPTGNLIDDLELPADIISTGLFNKNSIKATMINAGIPTIFIRAEDLGYKGTELQGDINNDEKALALFEILRAYGALKMDLINNIDQAISQQHTPKIAFIAKPQKYITSSGKVVEADTIDLLVRAVSMGKLHHAMMGTAAVAIGVAAAIPGTIVNLSAGGGGRRSVCFGHPSGVLTVGAEATKENDKWIVNRATMSRSARMLMDGVVCIPGDVLDE